MDIHLLRKENAEAYQKLRLAGLRDTPSAFTSSVEEESGLALETVGERLIATPDRFLLGAFVDHGMLAGVVGVEREAKRKLSHKAYVWGVYVDPGQRRRGLGRSLLLRAIEMATEMSGLRQLNLGVNAANFAAMSLYEELGFRPFGRERDFLQVDGVFHDEIHMVLPLERGMSAGMR